MLSPTVDFKASDAVVSSYQQALISPNSGLQTATTSNTLSPTITFDLPATAYNLARSQIELDWAQIGLANYAHWFNLGVLPIRGMQLRTRSNIMLAQWTANFADYSRQCAVAGRAAKFGRFIGADESDLVYPSNELATVNYTDAVGAVGSRNYTEQKYCKIGAIAGDVSGSFVISLGDLVGSIFETDKSLLFGQQLQLDITLATNDDWTWDSKSTTVPDLGDPNWSIASVTPITWSNIRMKLAIEQNLAIQNQLATMLQSEGGIQLPVGYVSLVAREFPNGGGVIMHEARIGRNYGRTLRKIQTVFLDGTAAVNLRHDRSNVTSQKTTSIFPTLNNKPLVQQPLLPANDDDWQYMKDIVRGSLLQSKQVFRQNFYFESNFDDGMPLSNTNNVISGIDLSQELTYRVNSLGPDVPLDVHFWVFAQKMLRISSSGIMID